eukprot:gnl/Trimastix_PCT/1767.p1 GENE.gnl/Trimastix_PCT/1767~~gnl/Trimastix_PCT/1767.p1  ORF type:complete len:467 (+),score=168.16 gnl/Trimastix_PCT/1767:77-1477(+)
MDTTEAKPKEQTFASLGLCSELVEICTTIGWKKPTPIQLATIPTALQGKDIIGLAETGSGKTGAFILPILNDLLANPRSGLFACVVAPTRELAFQIAEQFTALGASINLKCATLVGGVDITQQAIALSRHPHIAVATPGRLVDLLENVKGFSLRTIRYLVLDEADELLNMNFTVELDKIVQACPPNRKTYLYSATMTDKVQKLKRCCLRAKHTSRIEVSNKYQTVSTLVQQYLLVPAKDKDTYLVYLLNELAGKTMIIFTATCITTQRLALILRNLGLPALPIHGQMSQPTRLGALNQFKSGGSSILIATDVASRGLDIPTVDVVVNYDLPTHAKVYLHRVGRTARAGRTGRAVSFVTQYNIEHFQRVEQLTKQRMEQFPADHAAAKLLGQHVDQAAREAAQTMREQGSSKKDRRSLTSRLVEGNKDDDEADSRAVPSLPEALSTLAGNKRGGGKRGKRGNMKRRR